MKARQKERIIFSNRREIIKYVSMQRYQLHQLAHSGFSSSPRYNWLPTPRTVARASDRPLIYLFWLGSCNCYWYFIVFADSRCPSRSVTIYWFLFLSLVQLLDRGWCLYTLYHIIGTNYMSGLATCRMENPLLWFRVKRSSLPMITKHSHFLCTFLF